MRWLSITNDEGDGLLILADEPVSFSASRYSIEDLTQAKHPHELTRSDAVYLNIDLAQSGLGNGSCGPGVLPKYMLEPGEYEIALRFRVIGRL